MNPIHDNAPSSRGGTTGITPARILVVEDGLIMARDIERRLVTMGYAIAGLAASGEDAIRKARESHPDLVLMDVNLKGAIDGVQAAQEIRNEADIPIVYVTAYSDETTLRRARSTEPFGYVLKPFEERELRTMIEIALYRHAMDRSLRESEQRYRAIAEMTPGYAYSVAVRTDGSMAIEWVTDEFGLTGLPNDALTNLQPHVHPDDDSAIKDRMRHLLSGQQNVTEYRIITDSGEHRWWRDHARPLWDEAKVRIVRILGSAQDITERKVAERHAADMQHEHRDAEQKVQGHLLEYTRTVASLLAVLSGGRGRERKGGGTSLALRLQGILRVFEAVYNRPPLEGIDRQLRRLIADLFKRIGTARLTYTIHAEPVDLDDLSMARILLIVQELLENAVHHAYAGGSRGEISVEFHRAEQGKARLIVADGGSGLRKVVDLRRPKTAGLQLVLHLVKELKGNLECKRESGTAFIVTFPLKA